MSEDGISKHDQVLAGLVMSLQVAAMQQLGKIVDPATGEASRDLEQARATIDVLEMLKVKCREGTPPPVLRMLDGAVMDLQMNYLEERKRAAREGAGEESQADAPENAADAPEDAADEAGEEPEEPGTAGSE
jgi:hypothetical protein